MNTGCNFSAFRFCTEQNLAVHNNRVAVSKIKGYPRCIFTLKYLRTKTWEARELWLNCFGSFICFVLFLPWRVDVSKLGCSVRQKRRLNQLRPAMFYICVKSEGWALPAEWRRRLWPSRCQRTSTLATKGLYTPLRLEAPLLYSAFDPGGPPLLGYTLLLTQT